MILQIKSGRGTILDLNKQLKSMFGEGLDIDLPDSPTATSGHQPATHQAVSVPNGNVPGINLSWKTYEERAREFFAKHSPSNLEGNPSKFAKMLMMVTNGRGTVQGLNSQLQQMFDGNSIDLSPG